MGRTTMRLFSEGSSETVRPQVLQSRETASGVELTENSRVTSRELEGQFFEFCP